MAKSRWKRATIRGLLLITFLGLLLTAAPRGLWTTASGQIEEPASGSNNAAGPLISDALFLYASSVLDFDTQSFLETQPGPLASHVEYVDGEPWPAAESIQFNAMFFGLNPQLILTLLEAQTQLLTECCKNAIGVWGRQVAKLLIANAQASSQWSS